MSLWTEKSAAKATGGKAQGTWSAARVEIDSRRIQPGDLFVSLKGERYDGHNFIKDALKKGAVAAAVNKGFPLPNPPPQAGEGNLLVVADTLKALEDLGRFARARTTAKIIGVTGSVGKTSAKEMLKLALSAHGATYVGSGNFNNHIGTPLMLSNLPPEVKFAVFEMGMNHAGEISHLTRMVQPHVAAITTVEEVHREFFASMEALADAKAEIFDGMGLGGTAVLNADNPYCQRLKAAAAKRDIRNIFTFGEDKNADCRLLEYRATVSGCKVKANIFGKELAYTMKAVGRHWVATSLLTLAVTHALGLDDAKTAQALSAFSELKGRGQLSRLASGALLIDDSYNASPVAMRAALAKTSEVWEGAGKKGRKIAALGDMLELGSEAPKLHAALAADIERNGFHTVFTAGALMQQLHNALPAATRGAHVTKALDLLPLLSQLLQPGDIMLVKGSHGSHMYELADALTALEGKKDAV